MAPPYSTWMDDDSMTEGFVSIVSWALAEEIVKATGVRLALGTRFILLSIFWFAFFEIFLKANSLTMDFDFPKDQAIKVYSGAIFLATGSSIIHIYTSILYAKSYNVITSTIFCAFLHAFYNYYVWNADFTGASYWTYVITSWTMSTMFGVGIIVYYVFDKRFLSRFPV